MQFIINFLISYKWRHKFWAPNLKIFYPELLYNVDSALPLRLKERGASENEVQVVLSATFVGAGCFYSEEVLTIEFFLSNTPLFGHILLYIHYKMWPKSGECDHKKFNSKNFSTVMIESLKCSAFWSFYSFSETSQGRPKA